MPKRLCCDVCSLANPYCFSIAAFDRVQADFQPAASRPNSDLLRFRKFEIVTNRSSSFACRLRADALQAELDRALQQTMAAGLTARNRESAATAKLRGELEQAAEVAQHAVNHRMNALSGFEWRHRSGHVGSRRTGMHLVKLQNRHGEMVKS